MNRMVNEKAKSMKLNDELIFHNKVMKQLENLKQLIKPDKNYEDKMLQRDA